MTGEDIEAAKREAVEFFTLQIRQDLHGEDHLSRLFEIISEKRFGETAGIHYMVDWEKLFKEHECPVCKDVVSLQTGFYECKSCRLRLPLSTYEKAEEQYEKQVENQSKSKRIHEMLEKHGLSRQEIRDIWLDAKKSAGEYLQEKDE